MAAIIGLDDRSGRGDLRLALRRLGGQLQLARPDRHLRVGRGVHAAGERPRRPGRKRVLPLPVSGAFHTPLMAGAAEALSQALSEVTFLPGTGTFFSTTEVRSPEAGELAEVLARQLMSPVRFSQSMEALLQAADAPGRGAGGRARATCCRV